MEPLRLLGVALLVALFLVFGAKAINDWQNTPRTMGIHKLDDETVRFASNQYFAKMTTFAQLSLALLGASWTLLIVQQSRFRVAGMASVVAFVVTNLSFVASLIVYNFGYDFIIARIFHHQAFDLDAPFVALSRELQQIFFLLGCLGLAITILTGKRSRT